MKGKACWTLLDAFNYYFIHWKTIFFRREVIREIGDHVMPLRFCQPYINMCCMEGQGELYSYSIFELTVISLYQKPLTLEESIFGKSWNTCRAGTIYEVQLWFFLRHRIDVQIWKLNAIYRSAIKIAKIILHLNMFLMRGVSY